MAELVDWLWKIKSWQPGLQKLHNICQVDVCCTHVCCTHVCCTALDGCG